MMFATYLQMVPGKKKVFCFVLLFNPMGTPHFMMYMRPHCQMAPQCLHVSALFTTSHSQLTSSPNL